MHRSTRIPFLLTPYVLFSSLVLSSPARGKQPLPPTGEVRLSSGRVVGYRVDYNRNSIQHSLRVDGGFIASTPSGALMRFESPSMRLVKESILDEPTTVLGHGQNGEPLAGFRDGRICRVDPVSLELTERVKLSSEPQWIGWIGALGDRPAGLVVVAELSILKAFEERPVLVEGSVVHDLAAGKRYSMELRASAFMSDRAGGLWLGSDHGEWGGDVMRVDLEKGTVENIPGPKSSFFSKGKPYWSGILGFVELRDGQIWAHGGSMHGMGDGFIARIDKGVTSQLYELHPRWPLHEDEAGPEPPPELELSRPVLPVTQIIEQDDDLLVISYSGVFRVDKSLKDWRPVNRLEIQYPWLSGRRYGMGAYAVIEDVHPPSRSGEPFVLATIEDGYVTLEGDKAVPHAIAGQVDPFGIDDVTNSAEGVLLRDRFDLRDTEVSTVWRRGKEGWETVDFSPPFEMDPANPEPEWEEGNTSWHFPYVLVRPDGKIFTVNQSGGSPGTRTVARWADGKAVRMGREVSYNYSNDSFITPDGTLWNDSLGRLLRFQNGKWEVAAGNPYDPVSLEPIQGNLDVPGRVKPIPSNGPPWILLAPWGKALWRLDYEADGKKTKLVKLKLDEGADELKILDAIPWTGDLLLLATNAGLRTFHPAKGKLAKADLPEPPAPASKLTRDGLGRLWLGGEKGLWLSEPGAKAVESLDPVPSIKGIRVDALGPDPAHNDGVIVALGERGVVFLRAKAKS